MFRFVAVPGAINVMVKDEQSMSPSVKSSLEARKVVHSEPVSVGEHIDGPISRCIAHLVRSYRLTRYEGTGIFLEHREDIGNELSKSQMEAISAALSGNNIFPVKMEPSVKWSPTFNQIIPVSNPIRVSAYWGFIHDEEYSALFRGMPAYKKHVWDRVSRGEFGAVTHDPRSLGIVPTLAHLALRAHYKKNPLLDPHYIAEESFVSGGSAQGMVEAVSKMARSHVKTNESPSRILISVYRWMQKNQIDKKMDPLPTDPETLGKIKFESTTSAGINLHVEVWKQELDNIIIDYVNQTDKRTAGTAVRLLSVSLLEEIADKIRKHPNLEYDPSLFDPVRIVHKMSLKAESRPPGTDKYKTRVIFIVTAIKTYLDRVAYQPVMERSYGVGANGIGMKWLRGGARRFARLLGGHGGAKKFWLSLDISKFDQSVLASLLMIVLFLPWFLYSKGTPQFKQVEFLILWSIENSVAKVVKWFGNDWKIIFGLMFSGELMTSLGDSWYLEIIFDCFDQYLADLLPSDLRIKFLESFRRFKDYGDDGALSYCLWVLTHISPVRESGPTTLAYYLERYWHMELKMSDTYVSADDDPRPDVQLPALYTQLRDPPVYHATGPTNYESRLPNVGPEIEYRGLKFLKRYIIRYDFPTPQEGAYQFKNSQGDGWDDAPWRPTHDYFSKATCIAGNNQSEVNHLIRLRALALDTYGTNYRAYLFLMRSHDHLMKICGPGVIDAVRDRFSDMMSSQESYTSWGSEDRQLFERVGGFDGIQYIVDRFPSWNLIIERTMWDEATQQRITNSFVDRRYQSASQLCKVHKL